MAGLKSGCALAATIFTSGSAPIPLLHVKYHGINQLRLINLAGRLPFHRAHRELWPLSSFSATLQGDVDMPPRRLWSLVLAAAASAICLASIQSSSLGRVQASLSAHEHEIWTSAVHGSKFSPVPRTTARTSCEATRAPEALATPNPLLDNPDSDAKVTVSFIIGADGRVHSPLVLESAGPSEDRTVLDTVRSWRYRPATCNGVPTEAEAKVEFSSR